MRIRWAIQCTELDNYNVDKWARAVTDTEGCFVEPVYVRPFMEDLVEAIEFDEDDVPTIFVGSISLMKLLGKKKPDFCPCYFFDEKKSKYDWFVKHNKEHALNHDAEVVLLDEVEYLLRTRKQLFVRPVEDFKRFNGGVVYSDKLSEWYIDLQRFGVNGQFLEIEAIVADPKNFSLEFRAFLVGGQIIDVMQYLNNGRIDIHKVTDKQIRMMQEIVSDMQLPHENCVVDFCWYEQAFKVLEINCWNASGLYEHNVGLIVKTMNEHILERWQSG